MSLAENCAFQEWRGCFFPIINGSWISACTCALVKPFLNSRVLFLGCQPIILKIILHDGLHLTEVTCIKYLLISHIHKHTYEMNIWNTYIYFTCLLLKLSTLLWWSFICLNTQCSIPMFCMLPSSDSWIFSMFSVFITFIPVRINWKEIWVWWQCKHPQQTCWLCKYCLDMYLTVCDTLKVDVTIKCHIDLRLTAPIDH